MAKTKSSGPKPRDLPPDSEDYGGEQEQEQEVEENDQEQEELELEENEQEQENAGEEGKPPHIHNDGSSSPGKIFVGGLAKETTAAQFDKYFGKYGEVVDSVVMKDRNTGQPRGFGFVTYSDPSVVDKVIEEIHLINGKQVEIKRTIPKGASSSNNFEAKKIFVGGIPTTVDEDEFKDFFSKFGVVKEHQIVRDHTTNKSRGFGFITFESGESIDSLLANGDTIDFAGVKVEIKKAEPKKSGPPPWKSVDDLRASYGGYRDRYGGFDSGYGDSTFRSGSGYDRRSGGYGGFGTGDSGSPYAGYGGSGLGGYQDPYFDYHARYGGGLGRGYGGTMIGGYGGPDGYAGYGSSRYGASHESGFNGGYGGVGGSIYGNRDGYGRSAGGRYHPYSR